MRYLIILTLFLLRGAFACEPVIYLEKFNISPKSTAPAPVIPDFMVENIKRAVRADTCGFGRAFLVLKLKTPPTIRQGYTFEIVKGKLDSEFVLARQVTSTFDKGVYHLEPKFLS